MAFISVSDRERALTFYRDVLGFALRSSDAFGDFIQLEGALLRVTVLPDYHAHPHPVLGWNVRDIVATIQSMRAQGVVFMVYEGLGQDELGIWTDPEGQARSIFRFPGFQTCAPQIFDLGRTDPVAGPSPTYGMIVA